MWSGSKAVMSLRMERRQSNDLEIEYIEMAISWPPEGDEEARV